MAQPGLITNGRELWWVIRIPQDVCVVSQRCILLLAFRVMKVLGTKTDRATQPVSFSLGHSKRAHRSIVQVRCQERLFNGSIGLGCLGSSTRRWALLRLWLSKRCVKLLGGSCFSKTLSRSFLRHASTRRILYHVRWSQLCFLELLDNLHEVVFFLRFLPWLFL